MEARYEVFTAEAAVVLDLRLLRSCSSFWRFGREDASPAGFFVRTSPVFQPVRAATLRLEADVAVFANRKFREASMAKSVRAPESASSDSKSKRRKTAKHRLATSAAPRKSAKSRAISGALMSVEDEFNNLRAAHCAYDCVENFLTPIYRHDFEEFFVRPSELRALLEVVNREMVRRMQTVTDAIQLVRKALH